MGMLDKLQKINDLREIWKHEARDFSRWLSEEENLQELSDAIGIDIVAPERESSVGDFSVDIFAREDGTNRKIIIENQLSNTDHDHLGKIITYASVKSVEVIVWVVKRARDEHRQAIEWLNQHTDENIGFFLVEVELWKIGDSLPAVKFNVVEKPNDWAKTMKIVEGLSEIKKLQMDFWQKFIEYAFEKPDFAAEFNKRKPLPQQWYNLSVGKSDCHVSMTLNTQNKDNGVGLYISDNKDLYLKFKDKKDYIEKSIGSDIKFIEANKDSKIFTFMNADIKTQKEAELNKMFDWFCSMAIKFKNIAKDFHQ